MPVESSVGHTLGQQLTVQVEDGQSKKSGVPPRGVTSERGGAELLFDGVKKHQVTLPGQEEPWDIRNLLVWIKKNLLKERPELFIQGDSVLRLLPLLPGRSLTGTSKGRAPTTHSCSPNA
ncbi:ubiquitin-related modifier 1 isoform X2 [Pteropus alecto]|uniref:ubiquitin-related modifier 1 isoform X2 n=1 Tax=Pteropus alecto TaxID=9402 RepID=UPI000D53BAEC|nr:ubiquitin-related modifier 1 isoform X2 [Pteropus alecto]